MSHRSAPLLLVAALSVLPVAAQAPGDVRVALIIGNSAYAAAPLLNPANDAQAMAEVLRKLGFQVIELRDGSKAQMAAAVSRASDTLKGKRGVGMLYYAGHGLQLDWHNYMVPVDANLKSPADVLAQAVDLGTVVDTFKQAGNRMNIVVLDACRDNPFGASTSSAKGLAQLDAPPSTFLAYATAPGNVAEDGDAKTGNGLYTQYLLQELKRPTAKIEDVFKRVRLNVRKQSEGRQIPWESTSLEDDFFFNDGLKYTIKPDELERMAASALARVTDKNRAAEAARQQEVLRVAALSRPPDAKLSKDQVRELAFREWTAAWAAIRTSNNPDDFYAFLQRYPGAGDLAEAAQQRLDLLAKPLVVATAGKGQDASMAYRGERFRVGDEFHYQVSDLLTKVPGESGRLRVTSIEGDVVKFNTGRTLVSTLSATIQNGNGTFDPPLGGLPVELQVGKKWNGQSSNEAMNGTRYELKTESKIIGRETITVPAGTFQTYVIQTYLYSSAGVTFDQKSWIDPRYGISIRFENMGRSGSRVVRSELRELTSIKANRA